MKWKNNIFCIFMNEIYFYTFFRRIFFGMNSMDGCSFFSFLKLAWREKNSQIFMDCQTCLYTNKYMLVRTYKYMAERTDW